ncbi:hypothetical protein C8Q77DRAFT_1152009 [Trametes polyzona]|nr:hypothetical protein C8Q77DRAFT_1152009 [Trametes polyzona]
MTPLFAKFLRTQSSSRSTRSERRTSVDSYDSSVSYVISLPSIRSPRRSSLTPSFGSTTSSSSYTAEMIDDENSAWGRPPRKSRGPKLGLGWARF